MYFLFSVSHRGPIKHQVKLQKTFRRKRYMIKSWIITKIRFPSILKDMSYLFIESSLGQKLSSYTKTPIEKTSEHISSQVFIHFHSIYTLYTYIVTKCQTNLGKWERGVVSIHSNSTSVLEIYWITHIPSSGLAQREDII